MLVKAIPFVFVVAFIAVSVAAHGAEAVSHQGATNSRPPAAGFDIANRP